MTTSGGFAPYFGIELRRLPQPGVAERRAAGTPIAAQLGQVPTPA
jgi:hypothetical protein